MGGWRFLAPMLFTVIVGQVLLVRGSRDLQSTWHTALRMP